MKSFAIFFLIVAAVAGQQDSCVGRCGDENQTYDCQCNSVCSNFNDCCLDYIDVCLTCADRCGEVYDFSKPCQCNYECPDHGNCCDDFFSLCNVDPPPDNIIFNLTETLFHLDVNRKSLTYNVLSSGQLFDTTNNAEDLQGPTIDPFKELRGTYSSLECQAEQDSTIEIVAFLDAIFKTSIMSETEKFLIDNDLLPTKFLTLREAVEEIWFQLYSRCGSTLGSNGFEHVFVGEVKDNGGAGIGGYHNWISFYIDQMEGNLDYIAGSSYLEINGTEFSALEMEFDWLNENKPISSIYIGSSPELELALYTVCFFYQPNTLCTVSMNGVEQKIQTWTQNISPDVTGVGSAYVDLS